VDNEWHIMKLLDKSIKKQHSHVHVLLHKFATKIILNNDANFENIKNKSNRSVMYVWHIAKIFDIENFNATLM
jgi:hypothetical protein